MLAVCDKSVHVVFVCDVWGTSKQWLTNMGFATVLLADINFRIWDPDEGLMSTKDAEGTVATLTKEQADLDSYVCGFMCTPFAPNGDPCKLEE